MIDVNTKIKTVIIKNFKNFVKKNLNSYFALYDMSYSVLSQIPPGGYYVKHNK